MGCTVCEWNMGGKYYNMCERRKDIGALQTELTNYPTVYSVVKIHP